MKTVDTLSSKTQAELQALVQLLQGKLAEQVREIERLRHQLNNALHHRFGPKSEKYNPNQLCLFDEVVQPDNLEEIVKADEDLFLTAYARKKPGRKPINPNLPRIKQVHDLSEAEKTCACGCALVKIGEETTEQLDFIPAKAQVIQHVHYKYACKACEETIKSAKGPTHPIPKSVASPGLLAHIAVSKFCDHLPLYRMEAILQRMGIDIARQTLSHWMIKISRLLLPIYKLLQYTIVTYDIAFADETPVQVLKEPDRPPESKSTMWVFIGGPPEKRSVIYRYDVKRSHTTLIEMLEGFKGWLHCDGHSAYEAYAKIEPDVLLLGCWMHCRRKFYDIAKLTKTPGLAHQAVRKIAKLYEIEKAIKQQGLSPLQAYEYRQQHAATLLKLFKQWLDEKALRVLPSSPLGKAFGYALNQWEKLTRYLNEGRLQIDNGRSERKIKPFVIGRKNWLFCDRVAGAKAAEIIYSVMETAKEHQVEPYSYLRHLLARLPNITTESELEALLPYHIDRTLLTAL